MFNYFITEPSPENIFACIREYTLKEVPYLRKLYKYYNGDHAINRKEAPEGRPNNKVVTNFCKELVDNTNGFVNLLDSNSIYDLSEVESIFKDTLMVGIGYGLIEWDGGSRVLRRIPATKALLIKDTTLAHNPIVGVVLNPYSTFENGLRKEYVQFFVYDDTFVYEYVGTSIESADCISKKAHLQGTIPLFEAKSSTKYEGLYNHIISLQDSYNLIDSSYVDGRETFSNAFLCITGMSVSEETAESIIDGENKLLNLPLPDATASYLVKDDKSPDVISMLNNLSERIHKIACVPDFSQEGSYGVSSGKSNAFRIIAFKNLVNSRKNIFYNSFLKDIDLNFSWGEEAFDLAVYEGSVDKE